MSSASAQLQASPEPILQAFFALQQLPAPASQERQHEMKIALRRLPSNLVARSAALTACTTGERDHLSPEVALAADLITARKHLLGRLH